MAAKPVIVPGVVRGGVVYPEGGAPLPEGARVEIVLPAAQPQPESGPPPAGPDGTGAADLWEREE